MSVSYQTHAQSFIQDWKEVQDFYQKSKILTLKIQMTTSTNNNTVEIQSLQFNKYNKLYYYDLGEIEVSINSKSMLTVQHTQQHILRQSLPEKHLFGEQILPMDSVLKQYQDIIQYKGSQKGIRHYQIRPSKGRTSFIQIDYYFSGSGAKTRFRQAQMTYQYQGQIYNTKIQLTASTVLQNKALFQENYFLKREHQQFKGIGKYNNYRVTDQRCEK